MIPSHTIPASASLAEALAKINNLSGGAMTLFALSDSGAVAGTITDGDVRRALLAGHSLTEPSAVAMHTGFRAMRHNKDTFEAVRHARAAGIDLLPELDADGRILRIVDLRMVKNILPLDAVLMAGGRGERLRPLTLDTPKPLLKIGNKPIIDYNIEELEANGIERIYVTVNYLAGQIETHFAERRNKALIECVREPRRLGTIGSLSLIESLFQPDLLLMNSDLLTDLCYADMFAHHKKTESALTMAVIPYNVSIPFAVIRTDGDRITGLQEKPSLNYFANAGVYIMRTDLVKRIPKGEPLDAPDFVEMLIADGQKVTYFPISGRWIDIGSPEDFRLASKLMEQ